MIVLINWLHENKAFQDKKFHLKIYRHPTLYHLPFPKRETSFFNTKLIRFLIDRTLFKILSDKVRFEPSVIRFSLGFAVIDFSPRSLVFFIHHASISYQILLLLF